MIKSTLAACLLAMNLSLLTMARAWASEQWVPVPEGELQDVRSALVQALYAAKFSNCTATTIGDVIVFELPHNKTASGIKVFLMNDYGYKIEVSRNAGGQPVIRIVSTSVEEATEARFFTDPTDRAITRVDLAWKRLENVNSGTISHPRFEKVWVEKTAESCIAAQ